MSPRNRSTDAAEVRRQRHWTAVGTGMVFASMSISSVILYDAGDIAGAAFVAALALGAGWVALLTTPA